MMLSDFLSMAKSVDKKAMELSEKRWDSIAKPLKSLGVLEEGIIRIAGMQGTSKVDISKKAVVVMCADNGVVEEGVTQAPMEVTAVVTENFAKGKTSVTNMADVVHAKVFPVDIGVYRDLDEVGVIKKKIAYGTKNFTKEPAMTREQAEAAVLIGINMVKELKADGYNLIATGEMGIGNTTTSSAIASVLLGLSVEDVTGRGAGLSSEGLLRKIDAITRGIELHKPNKEDGIDVLSKVGGYDIAGMAGVFIGGAIYGVPIMVDGIISSVAALAAVTICPLAKDYMIASHVSKEPAGKSVVEKLDLKPFITCDMCLGEGTGAIAAMPILDMAVAVYNNMSTFDDIEIEEYMPQS